MESSAIDPNPLQGLMASVAAYPGRIQEPMDGARPVVRRHYNRAMSLRRLIRLALHWLVIVSMIATTLVAPVQAATDTLQSAAVAQMAATMADMPCDDDDMDTAATEHGTPCDCCSPASCDLSACLGTACLPELLRLVADIPAVTVRMPWNAPAPPFRPIDTPLRPPNA